jgi:hypothetical protein
MQKEPSHIDLAEMIDTLAIGMIDGFASLGDRLETLEKEVRSTNQHIDRVVMPLLDSHSNRIKNLEIKLA